MVETPEGVLLVDKPAGPTSHDLVAAVRRAFPGARVGHAGTLDPFATGLLLLLIGRATRLAEFASALEKTYAATLRLGASSATDDPDGEITEHLAAPVPSEDEVRAALAALVGEIEQVPPRFSAKRVGGERAYHMARHGAAFTLAAQTVHVHATQLLGYEPPFVRFRVRTGRGVYVRSLARDLGAALGSAGYLTQLRREEIGPFSAADGVDPRGRSAAELTERLLPSERAVEHLPVVPVDEQGARALVRGRAVEERSVAASPSGPVRLIGPDGFLGVGEARDGIVRPRKVLFPERAPS